jgi:hypothetical protein
MRGRKTLANLSYFFGQSKKNTRVFSCMHACFFHPLTLFGIFSLKKEKKNYKQMFEDTYENFWFVLYHGCKLPRENP